MTKVVRACGHAVALLTVGVLLGLVALGIVLVVRWLNG